MPELREIFLFRLESDPPAYLWSGLGNIDVLGDAIAGATRYTGAGELLSLPSVQQLINGTADRVEFTVSGVDVETMRLATEEDVRGAVVRIGSLALDAANQPYGAVEWEWEGVADVVSVESGSGVRSVTLSVGSADTARSRVDLAFFTSADQAKRSPGDRFFDHVAGISAGKTRRFGAAK